MRNLSAIYTVKLWVHCLAITGPGVSIGNIEELFLVDSIKVTQYVTKQTLMATNTNQKEVQVTGGRLVLKDAILLLRSLR
jgi:hypothetical protein